MKIFNHIALIFGSSENHHTALQQAIDLAEIHKAKITFIRCFSRINTLSQNQPKQNVSVEEMLEYKHNQILKNVTDVAGHIDYEVKVFFGKPHIEIIREVIHSKVDLVIKPVERSGLKDLLFDSLDLKLLRQCPAPVWLVKSAGQRSDKNILVAINHEPENPSNDLLNISLLEMAVSFALARSVEMHVIHAWNFENETLLKSLNVKYKKPQEIDSMVNEEKKERYKWLNQTVGDFLSGLSETCRQHLITSLHLVEGYAGFEIPKLAASIHAELLIMGTMGRTGVAGFITANTAETVLFNVDCSVMSIKPNDFVCPIESKELELQ